MDNISFGKLIVALRSREHITQKELAEVLGVSSSAVSKWETGKNLPDADIQQKIRDYFHLSYEEFFNPTETIANINAGNIKAAPQKAKWYKRKSNYILLICILLLGFLFSFLLFRLFSKNQLNTLQLIGIRHCDDSLWNSTIYEQSYVYNGKLDMDISNPYIKSIYLQWINDKNIPPDINILKISFYQSEDSAKSWESTDNYIYLFREVNPYEND